MTGARPDMIDISYCRQNGSVAAHLVNLNNPMAMGGYRREIMPAGPYEIDIELPAGVGRGRPCVRLKTAAMRAPAA